MKNNVTQIKCPSCQASIDVQDILAHQLEEQQRKADEQLHERVETKLKEERKAIEDKVKTKLAEENAGQIEAYQKELNEKSEQIKELNRTKAEIEKLKREKDELKEAVEAEAQKKLNEALNLEKDKIKKAEEEKNELKLKELQKQLEDQKKLTEEMKRRQEQGSTQLQGEVLELALEELLRTTFPYDVIDEVAKGVRGADCIQTVKNNLAQVCGKIIYESKRTKSFTNEWIEKLKADMRTQQADIAVIVTEVLPKELDTFGFKDGVWICRFNEVKGLSFLLRDSLIRVNTALVSQENKGDKMQMLYDYLTGNEFRQNVEAIVESFISLKDGITREKIQMEKIWKEREKQLDKVLLNTTQFYGSVKGIAGSAIQSVKALELPEAE